MKRSFALKFQSMINFVKAITRIHIKDLNVCCIGLPLVQLARSVQCSHDAGVCGEGLTTVKTDRSRGFEETTAGLSGKLEF